MVQSGNRNAVFVNVSPWDFSIQMNYGKTVATEREKKNRLTEAFNTIY